MVSPISSISFSASGDLDAIAPRKVEIDKLKNNSSSAKRVSFNKVVVVHRAYTAREYDRSYSEKKRKFEEISTSALGSLSTSVSAPVSAPVSSSFKFPWEITPNHLGSLSASVSAPVSASVSSRFKFAWEITS